MNDNKRRAIVWDTIERIAFRPNPPARWLGVYAKTLHDLWGMDRIFTRFSLNDEFTVSFLNLRCKHKIESESKYDVSFVHDSSDCLHLKIHVDPDYLSKASLQALVDNYPSQQIGKLSGDVEDVLDGMLFHPRCHVHLEDLGVRYMQLDLEKGGLGLHDIRVGGGIENPYIFLLHLRYQFCLVHTDVRRDERLRLINLFDNAIREKKQNVNAKELFNFKQ
jgi:hypothetical protein